MDDDEVRGPEYSAFGRLGLEDFARCGRGRSAANGCPEPLSGPAGRSCGRGSVSSIVAVEPGDGAHQEREPEARSLTL